MNTANLKDLLSEIAMRRALPLHRLAVMSKGAEPLRLDTPGNHRNGEWLARMINDLLGSTAIVHLRGLHYAIVAKGGILRPDGRPYINDDPSWSFLVDDAAKAARWLGYVGFDSIIDNRNEAPIIFEHRSYPDYDRPFLAAYGVDLDDLPRAIKIAPYLNFPPAKQRNRLLFFGEKSSLLPVVQPLAQHFEGDVFIASGEISDTLIHRMARNAVADGRRLVVFTLTDCDPSGYQMSVSIGHKLRCHREVFFPSLDFELHTVALTVEQVKDLRLPSTPLKPSEKRGDRWREKHGVEQTEVDLLASLDPARLTTMIEQAVSPFFDAGLAGRERTARAQWQAIAEQRLGQVLDGAVLERLRSDYQGARSRLEQINAGLEDLAGRTSISFPDYTPPEPILSGRHASLLVGTDMSLEEHIAILRERKGKD